MDESTVVEPQKMLKAIPTEALVKIVEILSPLDSEDRQRIVRAALTFLGETSIRQDGEGRDSPRKSEEPTGRAEVWMKQNQLEPEFLHQVFHFEGGKAEFIAAVPGSNAKQKTLNAYVLAGVAAFLATGDAKFDDKAARELCRRAGCLDTSNHATYIGGKGNEFVGSKEGGWSLTTPGMRRGAELIREAAG